MLTTDLALRFEPEYEKISRRFWQIPTVRRAFARLVQADASRHGAALAISGAEAAEDSSGRIRSPQWLHR